MNPSGVNETEYQDLLRLVQSRAGDSFRSAFCYDTDDWEALYLRGDVATEELRDSISVLFEQVRAHEPILRGSEYDRLGETRATVELYDDGVLLHFQKSETEGVVVTLDYEAARSLAGFVEQCNRVLNRDGE